jgi:hypothetical protein
MPTFDTKCAAVAKVFGKPEADRDDASFVRFLYDRRELATVRERGHRVPRYIAELDELEHAITTTLARIRERDGKRIYQEAVAHLREAAHA